MRPANTLLACSIAVFLSAGCTAAPSDTQSSKGTGAPISQFDPKSCYIAGDKFSDDATVSLECEGDAVAHIVFEKNKPTSTHGELDGWKPFSASHGTADDPDFIRVQIRKGEQICIYGRKLTEEPKDTWKDCRDDPKDKGGKMVDAGDTSWS